MQSGEPFLVRRSSGKNNEKMYSYLAGRAEYHQDKDQSINSREAIEIALLVEVPALACAEGPAARKCSTSAAI